MCFKLDNGSELFSVQAMQRLRKESSGAMGSRAWPVLGLGHAGGSPGGRLKGRNHFALEVYGFRSIR